MGITITVEQSEAAAGGWEFTATYVESDESGEVSHATATATIGGATGQEATDLFLNGARLALVQLEAEQS